VGPGEGPTGPPREVREPAADLAPADAAPAGAAPADVAVPWGTRGRRGRLGWPAPAWSPCPRLTWHSRLGC